MARLVSAEAKENLLKNKKSFPHDTYNTHDFFFCALCHRFCLLFYGQNPQDSYISGNATIEQTSLVRSKCLFIAIQKGYLARYM